MTALTPYAITGPILIVGNDGPMGERPWADGEEAYNYGASLLPGLSFYVGGTTTVQVDSLRVGASIGGRFYFSDGLGPEGWAGVARADWRTFTPNTYGAAYAHLPSGTTSVTVSGEVVDIDAPPGGHELLWGVSSGSDLTGYEPPNVESLSLGSNSVPLTFAPSTAGDVIVIALWMPVIVDPPPYPGGWDASPEGNVEGWRFALNDLSIVAGGPIPTRVYPRADGLGMGAPRIMDNRSPYTSARVFGMI